jgi:hypothetical protein
MARMWGPVGPVAAHRRVGDAVARSAEPVVNHRAQLPRVVVSPGAAGATVVVDVVAQAEGPLVDDAAAHESLKAPVVLDLQACVSSWIGICLTTNTIESSAVSVRAVLGTLGFRR